MGRMVVVARKLVNISVEKPEDMGDQEFEELVDRYYVRFSDVLDARTIRFEVEHIVSQFLPDSTTAVEVL